MFSSRLQKILDHLEFFKSFSEHVIGLQLIGYPNETQEGPTKSYFIESPQTTYHAISAIMDSDMETLKFLIEKNSLDVNAPIFNGFSALVLAEKLQDQEMLDLFLGQDQP